MPSISPRIRKTKQVRKKLFKYALKKFGSYEKIPSEQRRRLEREPVYFTGKDPVRELSLAAISMRDSEKALRKGISAFGEIVIRKKVMPNLNLPREEKIALEKAWFDMAKKDSDAYQKFWGMVNYSSNPKFLEKSRRQYYGFFITGLSLMLRKHLPKSRYENYDKMAERGEEIAQIFFRLASFEMQLNSSESRFAKRVGKKPKRKINMLFGWGWLQEKILEAKNATTFFESQENIDRGQLYEYDSKTKPIGVLAAIQYDYSKVKEFEVVSPQGEKIAIVSKRLSPIKSAFAEKEFQAGVVLFNLRIPVPEPIGEIKEGGNTYFLWRKLERDKSFGFDSPNVERQIEEIEKRLEQNGIKFYDFADRNFIITNEAGKPKVWLIDLERMQIPQRIVRRYLKK